MIDRAQAGELRAIFAAVDYTVDGVVAAIGATAHRALGRNQTEPAARALAGRDDPLATLIRLWLLQRPVPRAAVEAALPGLVEPLVRGGIVGPAPHTAAVTPGGGPTLQALVDIRPYGTETSGLWVCSDLTPGMDGSVAPMRPDFVLGVSPASSSLAQLTLRRPVGRALDLGTGCAVQSLHLAGHAGEIVATDLNPRALELAEVTLLLNEVEADLRLGDLFAPVGQDTFDLIVTNPPYVMSPPSGTRLAYREADRPADGLMAQIVAEGSRRLRPGGVLQILGNWVHPDDGSWQDRLRGWIEPTGCDAYVVQREVLDPAEYVELWLADAGLTGSPGYRARYAAWLDYFAAYGIGAVGLGWLTLHNAGSDRPDIALEEWPYAVEQPIAPALTARLDAVDRDRGLDDQDVLAVAWQVAPDVVMESTGAPGEPDPQHIVARQQRGFRRGESCDTALAGVLGACDGELPLGLIVDTVAGLLGTGSAELRAELVPRLRELAVAGFLAPAG